ncbi:MAG TPA: DUF192 domain-containing protein [Candidatus Ozemobacteraceae bacterium]|nr:DUF192 domain-containing protein [Candidatus Ozemobacteraceae bacterium]
MYLTVKKTDGTTVANRVGVADTFLTRLRGLMFTSPLGPGEGLLIEPCTSIHMMFMGYPIDAIFLDKDNRVVACYDVLPPWRGFSGWHRDAAKVLELPAGSREKSEVRVGETLSVEAA